MHGEMNEQDLSLSGGCITRLREENDSLQLSFVKLAWQGMELQQAAPKARICINGRICVHPSVTMVVQSTKSQC